VSRKSKWAYEELKAYLTYAVHNGIDPFGLHGSYAGAFGFAQFLPSNVLRYGRDGDGDGKVDLFHHPDAIESIAYFLKAHGWAQNMSRQDAHKVLFAYNRSIYYVNTILSVADKLKEKLILSVSK
jgi:membrane-bound lytic murein transglycosylase B